MPRINVVKNKISGRHRTSKKLVKSKAGKVGLKLMPLKPHDLVCEDFDFDQVYMNVAR